MGAGLERIPLGMRPTASRVSQAPGLPAMYSSGQHGLCTAGGAGLTGQNFLLAALGPLAFGSQTPARVMRLGVLGKTESRIEGLPSRVVLAARFWFWSPMPLAAALRIAVSRGGILSNGKDPVARGRTPTHSGPPPGGCPDSPADRAEFCAANPAGWGGRPTSGPTALLPGRCMRPRGSQARPSRPWRTPPCPTPGRCQSPRPRGPSRCTMPSTRPRRTMPEGLSPRSGCTKRHCRTLRQP